MEWKLAEGTVYDGEYVNQFIEANQALLPAGFTRGDVTVVRNCPEALVEVRFVIDAGENGSRPQAKVAKDVPCEKKKRDEKDK